MLTLSELLRWLPEETTEEDAGLPTAEELGRALADASFRSPPTNPFHRAWALGGLPAWVAFAYLSWWIRGRFSEAALRRRRLADANLRVALALLQRMSYLRGAVMKAGQLLAALPDVAPAQFVETLSRLHFQAPPMHVSLLRDHLADELGEAPETLFAEFEPEAFAAASLGQVHRAVLKSGERVAVKIQYPGIARTISTDLGMLTALLAPLRLSGDRDNLKAQLEDVRRTLVAETDYRREARWLEKARTLFDPAEGILVPRVFEDLSTQRVLTMELLPGCHASDWLRRRPPQAARNAFGEKIFRSLLRLYYSGRMNYADPNPGNFLFMDDGRLGLIDFGCVREFDDAEWRFLCGLEEILFQVPRGSEAFRDALADFCELDERQRREPERMEALEAANQWLMEPLESDGPFDFGDARHLQRGVELTLRLMEKRYTRGHPSYVLMHRTVLEGRGLLHRLGAVVAARAIRDQESRRTSPGAGPPPPELRRRTRSRRR